MSTHDDPRTDQTHRDRAHPSDDDPDVTPDAEDVIETFDDGEVTSPTYESDAPAPG